MKIRDYIHALVEMRNENKWSKVYDIIMLIAIIALPSGIITAGYMDEMRSRRDAMNKKNDHKHNSYGKKIISAFPMFFDHFQTHPL